MFFRKKKEEKVLYNSKRRICFVCLGGQVHASKIWELLAENNIGYSTITDYYQMDLTAYNTTILSKPNSESYLRENKYCYNEVDIYLVNPTNKDKQVQAPINKNIQYINQDDLTILNIVRVNKN